MSYSKNDVLEKGYEHGDSSATLDEDAAVLVRSPAPSIEKSLYNDDFYRPRWATRLPSPGGGVCLNPSLPLSVPCLSIPLD